MDTKGNSGVGGVGTGGVSVNGVGAADVGVSGVEADGIGTAAGVSGAHSSKNTPKIKGVLFDLDGTLIDSYELILTSFRYTINEICGKNVPDEELMAKVGQPLATQMWDFAETEEEHKRLLDIYRTHNESIHDKTIHSFPGVKEALVILQDAGLLLGVVTSKMSPLAARGLRACGLFDFFDFVVSPDTFPEHKPAPGPVKHSCELLKLKPSECIYLGDSPFDMQAGIAAGCVSVAALWGMFSKGELLANNPDYTCKSMKDFARLALDLA